MAPLRRALPWLLLPWALMACGAAPEATEPEEDLSPPPGCAPAQLTFSDADFDHVIDGYESTKTLRLTGAANDNTLVRNCRIHDTSDDGIFIQGVKNVVITGCTFENIGGQAAVRGSVTAGSSDVVLYDNTVIGAAMNGFNFGQRIADGVDHQRLRIIGNRLRDTGRDDDDGLTHGLYIQSQDFEISGNTILGPRDGNGISVRSSGVVRCNVVSGASKSRKPGIRYFSDHTVGPSDTLRIERNRVTGASVGVDLYQPAPRFGDGQATVEHVVKRFVITDNVLGGNTTPLAIAPAYFSSPFSVEEAGNVTE